MLEPEKNHQLNREVCIPALDDPIDDREVKKALKDCKKGGYDVTLPIL